MNSFPFSPVHDAALLRAAGYTHAFYPAFYEDIGDAENGPWLYGYPDTDVWTLDCGHYLHEIVVIDGEVVEASDMPMERMQEKES